MYWYPPVDTGTVVYTKLILILSGVLILISLPTNRYLPVDTGTVVYAKLILILSGVMELI
jgi:hypothetical protein